MAKKKPKVIVKQNPADFFVQEWTALKPGEQGPFSLYLLEKKGWTTPDALGTVCRRWRLNYRRIAFGGLKDRHAHTRQYFTVFHGPRRHLHHQRLTVQYLGQVEQPFTSQDIAGNRFRLVLRGLEDQVVTTALGALEEVRRQGIPNYFDDQRFGSVSPGQGFVAKALLRGDHEGALRLALVGRYEHDRAAPQKEKRLWRQHWGDWTTLKNLLPPGPGRCLADYLLHHADDYRGAVARLPSETRRFFLAVYQSHLWNLLLARWLENEVPADQRATIRLRQGCYPVPRGLDEARTHALQQLCLPLPSRSPLAPGDPRQTLLATILNEEQLTMAQFKLQGYPGMFFSRGERAALFLPEDLTAEAAEDDTRQDAKKLTLAFTLPRGCYATLVVKRLMQMA